MHSYSGGGSNMNKEPFCSRVKNKTIVFLNNYLPKIRTAVVKNTTNKKSK